MNVGSTDVRAEGGALERETMQKVTWRLMPFLMLCYFIANIDRVNVGFAGSDLRRDLGLSGTVFGLGAGIFFATYFLCEVPSNLMLVRFGARRWIARIMISWGIVAAGMALVRGPWSFYGLRALLGAAEAGFFPGVVLYLTFWFPRRYRARVVSYFMVAIPVSTFVASPLSGLILDRMNGAAGLLGWQWMFILEAVPAVLFGVACLGLLPERPHDAAWLRPDQARWLQAELESEQVAPAPGAAATVSRILFDRKVLVLALAGGGGIAVNLGLGFWQPQIIRSFGLGNTAAGFYNAIPYVISSVAMIAWSLRSDRTGERVWHTAGAMLVSAAGLLACLVLSGLVPTLVALTVALCGCYALKGPLWALSTAWLDARTAPAGIAQINAVGSLAGFVAPFLLGWIKDWTGSYVLGMLPMVALAIAGAVGVVLNARQGDRRSPGSAAAASMPRPSGTAGSK